MALTNTNRRPEVAEMKEPMEMEIDPPKKMGRPSSYTFEVSEEICRGWREAKACGRSAPRRGCRTEARSELVD
jgi:hypothetical protein